MREEGILIDVLRIGTRVDSYSCGGLERQNQVHMESREGYERGKWGEIFKIKGHLRNSIET